ncbi:MAG: hypothetical protein ACLTZY_15875 [Alistipes indistinctus]
MKLMTGLGMSYLQTDDSFPEWRYGPENEYQEEIRQLKGRNSQTENLPRRVEAARGNSPQGNR